MVHGGAGVVVAAGAKPEYMLTAEKITKSFDGLKALDEVNIFVRTGSIHGLIGPNGSGKSTFFNVATGTLPATSGRVRFNSRDITGLPAHKIAALGIARTFQGGLVFPILTCIENVMTGMYCQTSLDLFGTLLRAPFVRSKQERRCAETAGDMLDFVGLSSSARRPAGDLVWMERQLLQIARALVAQPRLVLLDEPTSGMGAEETERVVEIVERVRDSGVTVMVISHDVGFVARISDLVTVLSYGEKIYEGPPQEAQRDPRVLEVYLGTD
jgi:branched-chain amino acid transport system ATP-binding protein